MVSRFLPIAPWFSVTMLYRLDNVEALYTESKKARNEQIQHASIRVYVERVGL